MAEPGTQQPRKRRWGRVVLAVSLAANLLVAGLVAGAMLNGPRDRDRRPELRDIGFGPFVAALPKEDRRALAESYHAESGSFRMRREEMRRQFDAFLVALRAEPYDHAAVEAVISSQQEEVFATQRMARGLLLDHIGAMQPAERAAFADSLAKGLRHWKTPPKRD